MDQGHVFEYFIGDPSEMFGPEIDMSPEERFAHAQREFELMQMSYSGNTSHRDAVYSDYCDAFCEQMDLTGFQGALRNYWATGTRFFHHVVLLESIDAAPLSADHLHDTMTLLREFQDAEALVARVGFETVSLEDWRKSVKSPFEHHVPTPIFHLFPKKRQDGESVRLYADEFLQTAQAESVTHH
jgi:hypothetical protein